MIPGMEPEGRSYIERPEAGGTGQEAIRKRMNFIILQLRSLASHIQHTASLIMHLKSGYKDKEIQPCH